MPEHLQELAPSILAASIGDGSMDSKAAKARMKV